VTDDSDRAAWLRQARDRLRTADPVMARLIDDRPDFDPRAWMAQLPLMDLYGALLFQVTGQQLSVAATRHTLARIGALFGGRLPEPAELLVVNPATLREAGLSSASQASSRCRRSRSADAPHRGRAGGHADINALAEDEGPRRQDDQIIVRLHVRPPPCG
jgi:hypothetical protein